MSQKIIKIDAPRQAVGVKEVVFNGDRYSLMNASELVFRVLPGKAPTLSIEYVSGETGRKDEPTEGEGGGQKSGVVAS